MVRNDFDPLHCMTNTSLLAQVTMTVGLGCAAAADFIIMLTTAYYIRLQRHKYVASKRFNLYYLFSHQLILKGKPSAWKLGGHRPHV